MAKKDAIRVWIESDRVAISALGEILRSLSSALTSISNDKDIENPNDWLTSVRRGSIVHEIERPQRPCDVEKVSDALFEQLESLRNLQTDEFVSRESLRAIARFSKATNLLPKKSIRLDYGRNTAIVDEEIHAVVEAIVGAKHRDLGSVEGIVVGVMAKGRNHVFVKTPLHGEVKCLVDDSQLSEFLTLFKKRVCVGGMKSYDSEGRLLSIDVSEILVLSDPDKTPTIEDVWDGLGRGTK